jgi:hypothetical protein
MLRCPLCQAQFALRDVALDAVVAPTVLVLDEAATATDADVSNEGVESIGQEAEACEPAVEFVAPASVEEPEGGLPAEVDSLRTKAEAFAGSVDPSAADPKGLQEQADALGQEAQTLLAQVGQLTAEARQAEAAAMALVAKAQGHRKNAGSAIGSLADALDTVARAFDENCLALQAQLPAETPAVEEEATQETVEEAPPSEPANDEANPLAFLSQEQVADETTEPPTDEPVAVEEPEAEAAAEESKPDDQASDPFAFLKQPETDSTEEAATESEEKPEPEEPELSVKETDMFSFLAGIDAAAKGEPEPSASEAEVTPEEASLPVPESEVVQEASETPASEAPAEPVEQGAELVEQGTELVEQGTESLVAEEAAPAVTETPAVDVEAIRVQLETLQSVASALRAKAAQLREEASSLVDETTEYAVQETTEEGGWDVPWQAQGAESAAGAFAFGEGAADGASGRAIRPGRRRKETSIVKELIGIVVGGVGGLLIAYYGLNYFGGARFDFAKFYLPGIAHTVKHRPAWWPKWAQLEGVDTPEEADAEQTTQEAAAITPPPVPVAAKSSKPANKPTTKPAKTSKPARPAKPVKKASKEDSELAAPLDLGDAPELPAMSGAASELSPPTDLMVSPDLKVSSDLMVSPDLAVPEPAASKPAPKKETKPAPKQEAEPEAKQESRTAPKEETKAAPEQESKPAAKETAKPAAEAAKDSESKSASALTGYVDLKNRPTYTPDELAKSLTMVHKTFGCPKCSSTGKVDGAVCPDCQGHPPESLNEEAYAGFCRLGEVLAFVDSAEGGQLEAPKAAARALVEKIGAKPQNVKQIESLAASLLANEQRKGPGIVFVGTVLETVDKGKLHAATLKLDGSDRTIKVIGKEPFDLTAKDRAVVAGCLVKNGSSNGSESAFVWRAVVSKLGK